MGGSSAPSHITQTTRAELPQWAQPYAKTFLKRASELSNEPYQPYTGTVIAPLRPEHETALGLITQRALTGSPVTEAAKADLFRTIQGNYLSPSSNPWLFGQYQYAADAVTRNYLNSLLPQLSGAASRAGAFGGSADTLLRAQLANDYMRNLTGLASDLFGKAYENERQRQMQAQFFAPQLAETDYADMTRLLGVGDIYRQYQQDLLNEAYRAWQEGRQWPYSQVSFLGQAIPLAVGNAGTTTTTQSASPYQPSFASSLFGGLSSGAGLGTLVGMATGNPLLGALAGLGGLLGGLFR